VYYFSYEMNENVIVFALTVAIATAIIAVATIISLEN
jgi:hypothetical protein